MTPAHAPAHPFFLPTAAGERFCLYHAAHGACRGALVYLHPFGDEMNKTRRMAAMTARALAASGIAVLQIDLHGCGDSDGEFADARWERWKQDAQDACAWLQEQCGHVPGLWGLRLGALLALDVARTHPVSRLLLWHPVLQGSPFLTQFLRLRVASAMLDADAQGAGGTAQLRADLDAGRTLEVAGYELAPALASAIDALDAASLVPACRLDWIDVVATADRPQPPASVRVAARWQREAGLHRVAGPAFWATQEIEDCPELVARTIALLEHDHA